MNIWKSALITAAGLTLQSKLMAGQTLQITKIEAGTGRVNEDVLADQTAVKNTAMELSMNPVRVLGEGQVLLPVYLLNNNVETAFDITQVGVYANDPDDGEILFFIAQVDAESDGEHVPSKTEMPAFSIEWFFKFSFGNADGVTVTIDPAGFVTRSEGDYLYIRKIPAEGGVITGTYPDLTIADGAITQDMLSPDLDFSNVTASKTKYALTLKVNGQTIVFDGSSAKTVDLTLDGIGAAAADHTHAIADVTGLQTALNGKAASAHTHAIADVIGLLTALDGKAETGHTHKIQENNVSVATSAWTDSTAHEDYPYQATISITGATSSMVPEVNFSFADAVSGNFAPVAQSATGGVIIYAKVAPTLAITIPTIIIWN